MANKPDFVFKITGTEINATTTVYRSGDPEIEFELELITQ
jgi:hypothetical protein